MLYYCITSRPEYDDVIHDNNDDDYDDDQYCSTSHRNKGGQLKGREAKFGEGDIVEVLYDEDEDVEPEWYEATVLNKVEYQDDIRLVWWNRFSLTIVLDCIQCSFPTCTFLLLL